jgi:serine/threonine protein kinase
MAGEHDHDAHEGGEYCLGRHRVPVDVVAVPARRPRDLTTRPIAIEPTQPVGPTLEDLARLDAGEATTVQVARYRLERRLGKGGMASVYRGMHLTLRRSVAVKVLTHDLTTHPDSLARFMNEARLHALVQHPNVIEVLDFGATPEGVAFLVMQLHEGENLRATLNRETTLGWTRTRALILQLCAALEAVHAQGIVHRDIKPSNCLRRVEDGREWLKLADFGVACRVGDKAENVVVGTPEYMSPEQAKCGVLDTRSDVYSLGIVLGELLTGKVPFTGKPMSAVLDAQMHERPPKLAKLAGPRAFVPAALEQLYQRALAKDPEQRFTTVGDFATALLAIDEVPVMGCDAGVTVIGEDDTLPGRPFVIDPRPSWRSLAHGGRVAVGGRR